uniref:Pyrimidine-specific ribonucleoside hydrolase RihA n=1 Tax=Anthurium amnicola TaxID=1678845 RepID=A0A1D1XU50_9ARAE
MQGNRKYSPLRQPTAQQVMINTISAGPTTVLVIGAHTNFAIFLMTNPHLKRNIEHIYIMGGGVRSKNPTGCCPKNATSCKPRQCGDHGNLFTGYNGNPYAEFNIFGDPFAAYQVIHSGIPVTLVPLDATNTIPINEEFFMAFERNQSTYEAQYCFQSLKLARDTWFDDQFYTSYFMWDSFTSGVAVSIMLNGYGNNGDNEFAEMEYINITVVTSNKPYGVYDGSNPFFDGRASPKFDLQKGGVHSGHVQMGLRDPFCLPDDGTEKGKCEDGYTKEINGSEETVRVLVAQKAKPNRESNSLLDREFFINFLDVLNFPMQSGRFNFTKQFLYYEELFYKPDLKNRKLGKPVVFDMDMSAGDFISLIYLLKIPVEIINLKGILVSGNGWANAATIDVIYDVLHMMGRDDILVGLGNVTPLQDPFYSCKYVRHLPHGSGGLLDSDTLYGLARDLPRSPRRYTAENSIKYGAPRNTDHPELRQPSAMEIWQSVSEEVHLNGDKKITILTNGPLTNLAKIILSDKNASSTIQSVYIVGGHVTEDRKEKGNIFTVPSNKYSEFNLFLDPPAAKTIIESDLDIMLIPLGAQRRVSSFPTILKRLYKTNRTPESTFVHCLLSRMYRLQQEHHRYRHMDTFLGEMLGAAVLVGDPLLKTVCQAKNVTVLAGDITRDGQVTIDKVHGKPIRILYSLDSEGYYDHFARTLGNKAQSAVIGSFNEQKRKWSSPPR